MTSPSTPQPLADRLVTTFGDVDGDTVTIIEDAGSVTQIYRLPDGTERNRRVMTPDDLAEFGTTARDWARTYASMVIRDGYAQIESGRTT